MVRENDGSITPSPAKFWSEFLFWRSHSNAFASSATHLNSSSTVAATKNIGNKKTKLPTAKTMFPLLSVEVRVFYPGDDRPGHIFSSQTIEDYVDAFKIGRFQIGRSSVPSELVFGHISREHGEIQFQREHKKWIYKDSSTFGTKLVRNGITKATENPLHLHDNDLLILPETNDEKAPEIHIKII